MPGRRNSPKRPHQIRLHPSLVLCLPFLVAGVLIAIPAAVHKTGRIQMDVATSDVSFDVGGVSSSEIFGSRQLGELNLSGLEALRFPVGVLERLEAGTANSGRWTVLSENGGFIADPNAKIVLPRCALQRLLVKPSTKVALSVATAAPSRVSALFTRGGFSGEIVVDSTVLLTGCFGCVVSGSPLPDGATLRIRSPRRQILDFEGNDGPLSMVPDSAGTISGEMAVPVSAARFFKLSSDGLQQRPAILRESRVTLLDKDGKVEPGEFLFLTGAAGLSIQSIDAGSVLQVRMAGPVASALKGFDLHAMEEMLPRWLQWLHSQSLWMGLIADIALVGSTALAVLRGLKLIRQEKSR
jgi:hypothetical protein